MTKKAVTYTETTSIKLTTEQQKLIRQRAKIRGVTASVWMRSVLLQAARSAARHSSEGYIRIREPDGMTT